MGYVVRTHRATGQVLGVLLGSTVGCAVGLGAGPLGVTVGGLLVEGGAVLGVLLGVLGAGTGQSLVHPALPSSRPTVRAAVMRARRTLHPRLGSLSTSRAPRQSAVDEHGVVVLAHQIAAGLALLYAQLLFQRPDAGL